MESKYSTTLANIWQDLFTVITSVFEMLKSEGVNRAGINRSEDDKMDSDEI